MREREFRLRGYAVERLIGRGGSGEVWQARAQSSGAPVALKRIPVADESQRRRARDEAALLAALDHANIVRLHTALDGADSLVLVLDLAEAGSLADLLRLRRVLSPGEVISALAPVAAAVAYLHEESVVHGDVSPANVLFTEAGVPLLADVGVARLTGDRDEVAATAEYIDPAVANGAIPGPPSDVFSLAGTALHALTGTPTWSGDNAEDVLGAASGGAIENLAQRLADADVPEAMAAVLARALHPDPQRRGSAAEFALDLRHSGTPVAVALPPALSRPAPAPVRGPRHAAGAKRPVAATGGERGARPGFARPDGPRGTGTAHEPAAPGPAGGAPPPTRLVAARPRPLVPRPSGRGTRLQSRRRWLALGAALAAVLAAGIWWAAAPQGRSHGRRPPVAEPGAAASTGADRSATSEPVLPESPARGSAASGSAARGSARSRSAAQWITALSRLDHLREKAFETRTPNLLRQVYRRGPLLRTDRQLLMHVVPSGCGLFGVHTTYSDLHVERRGTSTILTVRASLSPSQLICHGHERGRAPGAGPQRLRLELAHTSAGPRIVDQRPA